MRKNQPIPALLAAALLSACPPLSADTVYAFGAVGDFPVAASLEREGEDLSGWYFYLSQGREILLRGKLGPDGLFRLEETDNDTMTGVFEGGVKQGRWAGLWRKNGTAAPLPFSFEENRDPPATLTGRFHCAATERDKKYHYTYQRNLALVIKQGVVRKFDAGQASISDDGDEQRCALGLGDLEQAKSEAGVLLKAGDGEECAVRILGGKNTVWVQFGGPGNDCRGTGDTMFCSPRAFWHDMVLDRRTNQCKILK